MEGIIDDWILLGFLVGNDFLPHLPHLHINKGALSELYEIYKKELPGLGGTFIFVVLLLSKITKINFKLEFINASISSNI
jgi:5'-3' exonuclease